jgi:membrane fusion protein, multidrug efflux system
MNNNQIKLPRTLWQLPVFGFLAIAALGCTIKAGELDNPATEQKPAAVIGTPVDAVVLQSSELKEVIDVNATLVANQEVEIVSETTRKILDVHVREGSKVKKGALLFNLDDADLRAQLEKLRQQEKLALLNETRLKDLLAHDAVAQQDYDEASTQLSVLQAQLQELRVAIEKTKIRAPFDGQIGMINVHPGSIVSTNTTLTDIEDNRVIKIEFSVPEKFASLIKVGSEITFTTTSATDKLHAAKISAVSARLNENTRSLLVRASAPNPNGTLFPGQSARVTLSFNNSPDALSVSANALIPSPAGYTVFVARKGVAQPVPVEIGQRNSSTIQIVSGLHKGDTVITSNLLRLGPGAPVSFASVK